MSKAKGFLIGIAAGAAALAAFKALPKNRQEELKVKATETSDALREKAYDAAYATADFAGDVTVFYQAVVEAFL